jgi:RHS repeat-associated protein
VRFSTKVYGSDFDPHTGATRFLYDGDRLILEYNSSGVVQRRYVHGANLDEPMVWYEGATLSAANRRYLHADHQGSIIATSNAAGTKLDLGTYDAYGVTTAPSSWRFQYTGQTAIAQVGLYYYKARFYNPSLGRFMQTDPIGYDDDLNLYAYVGNDPVNLIDPNGLSDLNLFPPVDGLWAAGEAFDMPGTFTITGHANANNGFLSNGQWFGANQLHKAMIAAGYKGGPVALLGCNLSNGSIPKQLAGLAGNIVISPNGFVFLPTTKPPPGGVPYKPGDPVTVSVGKTKGGPHDGSFADNYGTSHGDRMTYDPEKSELTKYFTPTGSRIERRESVKCTEADKGVMKCGK